jgi:hypothetical protein
VNPAVKIDQSTFQPGLILFPRDAVDTGGGFPLRGKQAFPERPDCQMVEQGGKLHPLPFLCRTLAGRFRHVVGMQDGDVTGRKAGKTVAGRLRPHCTVQVVELPLGTQPDQLSTEAAGGILQPTLQRRLAV